MFFFPPTCLASCCCGNITARCCLKPGGQAKALVAYVVIFALGILWYCMDAEKCSEWGDAYDV